MRSAKLAGACAAELGPLRHRRGAVGARCGGCGGGPFLPRDRDAGSLPPLRLRLPPRCRRPFSFSPRLSPCLGMNWHPCARARRARAPARPGSRTLCLRDNGRARCLPRDGGGGLEPAAVCRGWGGRAASGRRPRRSAVTPGGKLSAFGQGGSERKRRVSESLSAQLSAPLKYLRVNIFVGHVCILHGWVNTYICNLHRCNCIYICI